MIGNTGMMLLDTSIKDKTINTKGSNINIRSGPGTTNKVVATVAASGTAVGKSTGYIFKDTADPKLAWYQFDGGAYGAAFIRDDLLTISGSTTSSTTSTTTKNDDAEAQKLLDEIVAQDKETMNNLNLAAALIESLKAKGVNTTASANKLTAIFSRLQERQEAMKKTTWGKVKDTISNAWGSVKNFFGLKGLGIVPIVVIGVIALVAGAGTTALVLIKPWKNQSNIDFKESKELKELLNNADPVVAAAIRKNIDDQFYDAQKNAAEQAARQARWDGFWKNNKNLLMIGAALLLVPMLMNYFDKTKKR